MSRENRVMSREGEHRLRVRSAWVASWIALALPLSAVAQVDVRVVTLPSASVVDESATLPASQSLFARGDTVFLEVWAQTAEPNGFASIGVDLTFDAARLTAGAITHSSILGIFTNGAADSVAGSINDLSGAHAPATPPCGDTVGAAPKWVLLASISMVADAVGECRHWILGLG